MLSDAPYLYMLSGVPCMIYALHENADVLLIQSVNARYLNGSQVAPRSTCLKRHTSFFSVLLLLFTLAYHAGPNTAWIS